MSHEKHGLDNLMEHQLVERFPLGDLNKTSVNSLTSVLIYHSKVKI